MDWARAIERNSEALKGILAGLFAMLGEAGGAARIPRALHRAVLAVLRPAESAVRRLIVIAARGLVFKPAAARPMPQGPIGRGQSRARRPSFPLFDPQKRFAYQRRKPGPRARTYVFTFPGHDPRIPEFLRAPPPSPPASPPDDGCIDARRITSRLEAVKLALEDLPRQARRLVRLRARREKLPYSLKYPMRPGHAPGRRKRPIHPVDHVLAECHSLARYALEPVAASPNKPAPEIIFE